MQVSKWGNSLAIRLPKAIVDLLQLKEGDEVEVTVRGQHQIDIEREKSFAKQREEILARLKELGSSLPPGFRFDRDEANER